ncbi:MAG: hypothetical protein NTU94_09410 [Planctomycetota bacterium]|nr:hypothetical protein [Planctomycetota bacterium]
MSRTSEQRGFTASGASSEEGKTMDEAALRQKVGQLLAEVHRLPTGEPKVPAGKSPATVLAGSGMKREMAALEDGLDQIRLAVKYLVFDLEATKRENHLLRRMLGE